MEHPSSAKASAGKKTGSSAEASAKAGKYLKYAIGEIILVVIGILIALSINNWNEERKNKIESVIVLTNLKSELIEDLATLNTRIESLQRRKDCSDYLAQLITGNIKKTESDSSDAIAKCLMQSGYIYKFAPSFAVYNEIQNAGKLNLIKSDSIKKYLADYKSKVYENERIESPYEITLKNFESKAVNFLSEIPLTKKNRTIDRYKLVDSNFQELSNDKEFLELLKHISYITNIELELKKNFLMPTIKLLTELVEKELEL